MAEEFGHLDAKGKERLLALLKQKKFREDHTVIDRYEPYIWQKDFLTASKDNAQVLLMTGNRCGKTFTGAAGMSYHATGLYPAWWEGKRFYKPIKAWAAGVSNAKTREIVQSELLGDADNPMAFGTGAIPLEHIVSTTRLPGVPNAFQNVIVKHYNEHGKYDGNSRIGFLSYEMGFEKFMGSALDYIWLDEEPSYPIFSQCITRTADTDGILVMTFTPETGMTPVVHMFLNDLKPGQRIVRAGWDDVTHLSKERQVQLLATYLPHEREMRRRGEPVFGSGMVFAVDPDAIRIAPFDIPPYWPRLAGLDFGWEHPTAVVWMALDPDNDIIYVYGDYKKKKTIIPLHAVAIRSRGLNIPVAWPHDGYQHEKGSGTSMADQYRDELVNMLPFHFTNPPAPGKKEGTGGISVEAGIMELLTRMETGRFKVFSTCGGFWEEFTQYHRQDGVIVKLFDDTMSACRYGVMSIRFAETASTHWDSGSSTIEYPDLGVV